MDSLLGRVLIAILCISGVIYRLTPRDINIELKDTQYLRCDHEVGCVVVEKPISRVTPKQSLLNE